MALGHAIRDLALLQKQHGGGRWRKMKAEHSWGSRTGGDGGVRGKVGRTFSSWTSERVVARQRLWA
jgi:hypothetical protein